MTEAELAAQVLALLRDRFGLVAHEEIRQETIYFLEQQKSGSKMKPSAPGTEYSMNRTAEGANLQAERMAHFAGTLSRMQDIAAPVIDNTGLAGTFDFFFPYIHVSQGVDAAAPADVTPEVAKRLEAAYSSTFEAVRSVGLQLRPGKSSVTAVVIDQIHRPTEN